MHNCTTRFIHKHKNVLKKKKKMREKGVTNESNDLGIDTILTRWHKSDKYEETAAFPSKNTFFYIYYNLLSTQLLCLTTRMFMPFPCLCGFSPVAPVSIDITYMEASYDQAIDSRSDSSHCLLTAHKAKFHCHFCTVLTYTKKNKTCRKKNTKTSLQPNQDAK